MNYLLDSNTISDLYDKDSSAHDLIIYSLSKLTDDDAVFISIMTLYELEYGYSNAPMDKKEMVRKKITEVKEDFGVLPLSINGSERFGHLKKRLVDDRMLKKENAKKHNIDVIIASTAIVNQCTIVSADSIYTDIQRLVPEFRVVNWIS